MPRKSSIHFKPVTNVRFAVSHSERTDLSEPAYLLPKEHQLDNIVVTGSLSENDLAALFIQQKEGMTRQAKTAGASPFWEGVVVLPNTDSREQSSNLKSWKKQYEQATGHKVLHMSVHLDEGYLDALGKPQYNPHAHVIVSRMDGKNRVINLDRKQLAQVQDLTAEALQMERGSTLAERQGKRGRAHVPHREFRTQAEEKRLELDKPNADLVRLQKLSKQWSDADLEKVKKLQAKLDGEPARQAAALAAQKTQLDEQYRQDRAALKASGEAKQKDYQALKVAHEKALADLTATKVEAAKVPGLEKQVADTQQQATKQATEAQTLIAQYQRDREALKASGEATQRDYQALKKAHEAALADLKAQAMAVITPLRTEVKTMKKQITQLQEENARLEAISRITLKTLEVDFGVDIAPAAKLKGEALEKWCQNAEDVVMRQQFAEMAKNYQADRAAGLPSHLIVPDPVPRTPSSNTLTPAPRPAEATRTTPEPPKQPAAPIPSPNPTKSLVERLAASWEAMLGWIKGVGVHVAIDTNLNQTHSGAVKHLDDLHAVQHKGRGQYAVHRLADLDRVPALDDPKTSITYRGGKGTVEGRTGPGVQR